MRPSTRHLLSILAALATLLAVPATASADPVCVGVGYSVLGSGSDFRFCHPTPVTTANVSTSVGDTSLVQVRVSLDVPFPL